jgi:pimeloyl-ACP methyl ester carboxylesterase
MPKPPLKNPLKHLRATDLRAIAQLATQATSSVTQITEGVHQSVWSTLGAPGGKAAGRTRGITGLVYKSVQGVTQLVGKGLDVALTTLQPWLETAMNTQGETPERQAVLAALNGVMGDRLAQSDNPLATPMSLRYEGQAINVQAPAISSAKGKVLLLIHGLCMNDLQWRTPTADHGAALAAAPGYTPIYLRYNTGLHTSQNGRELAAQLEILLAHWPVALEELTVVVHSMGGLVIRSALHIAQQEGLNWPKHLKNIVFLGTPHHGAPLEKAGNWVDIILGSTPYSKPLAKLGQLRSAGITDLRYGHVLDADWKDQDRFRRKPDKRLHVPLPEGIACYTIAASTATKRSALADRLIGDGLVPLYSALGKHDLVRRNLAFPKAAQCIFYRMNHLQLLSSTEVTQQMLKWLKA